MSMIEEQDIFLTCDDCGYEGLEVIRIVCGYLVDINGVPEDDEDSMENVCPDCERAHCDEI
jgi:hypothetical protein